MPRRGPPRRGANPQGKREETLNSNIRVVVRVRPQNGHEREAQNSRIVIRLLDEKVLTFDPQEEASPSSYFRGRRVRRNVMKRKNRDMQFAFDHVFSESCSQEYVYEHTTKSIVDSVLSGYNCSVFAYGATGAGKTFTMLGGPNQPGIMFLTVMELYNKIACSSSERLCDVAVSYLEIYNETVKDLLVPSGPLAIREDPTKGVVVSGLSLHKPKNAKELFSMLEYGNTNRTQHPTDANAQSSRSHAVFQVFVRQRDRTANISADVRVAKMSLIDLAGSERATVTTNRGARFREGANINRSLLALGNCINALADTRNKGKHVPYRNSKLTRLLKDSLGGNCKTVMIAAVSPSSLTYEDTLNTLKYANRAKEIKSTLQKNVVSIDLHISRYTQIIEELRTEVAELKGKLQQQMVVGTMATVSQQPPFPVQENEQIVGLRVELHRMFQERSSIRKELLELESFDRDLTAKIMRKNLLVERIRLIHGKSVLGEKTMTKLDRVIANSTVRQTRARSRKAGVEQRMKENEDALSRLTEEMKKAGTDDAVPEVLQESMRMRHLEIEVKDGRRQAKHLRKFARHQEAHIKSSEKLILRLLTVVRNQFFLIKGSGIATPDLEAEFEAVQKQVEGDNEVRWADQNQSLGDGVGRASSAGAVAGGEDGDMESFNRLLNLPVLSCVNITPNAPYRRRSSKTQSPHVEQIQVAAVSTPHQPIPSRRLSYATTCQTTVGITPTAFGQAFRIPTPGSQIATAQPQRLTTPGSSGPQRVPTPQRDVKSPSTPAQRIPTPQRTNQNHPTRIPTPQHTNQRQQQEQLMNADSIGQSPAAMIHSNPPTEEVEQSSSPVPAAVESATLAGTGVVSTSSPQVTKEDPQLQFRIDGIVPLQGTPPCNLPSSQVEQSTDVASIASQVPANSGSGFASCGQGSVTSSEAHLSLTSGDTYSLASGDAYSSSMPAPGISTEVDGAKSPPTNQEAVARTISFEEEGSDKASLQAKSSPVTVQKMTYAQVASSPIPIQPARKPFGEISVNSPRIAAAPSPAQKVPGLNESFTICKGVLQENFRKDINQRGHNRRDTFTGRSRPSLHHQRSKSQGQLNVGGNKTQHTETLRKYGLPSMADSVTDGASKPRPAYMSMTKAAANKRRGNTGTQRPFTQSTKENQFPTTKGRPVFTSGPGPLQSVAQHGTRSNLARSFSVGNLRHASKNMSSNRNQSTWNF